MRGFIVKAPEAPDRGGMGEGSLQLTVTDRTSSGQRLAGESNGSTVRGVRVVMACESGTTRATPASRSCGAEFRQRSESALADATPRQLNPESASKTSRAAGRERFLLAAGGPAQSGVPRSGL